MGVAGSFVGIRAQSKTLRGIEAGAFQATVVERQAFTLAVFHKQFAVIHACERIFDDAFRACLVESRAIEK